jgi:hypothetical protein
MQQQHTMTLPKVQYILEAFIISNKLIGIFKGYGFVTNLQLTMGKTTYLSLSTFKEAEAEKKAF